MSGTVIVDAGPLVALLVRTERNHHWVREQTNRLEAPLHTCEAAIAEAAHLLRRGGGDETALLEMIEQSVLKVSFVLWEEASAVHRFMQAYRDVPMSLADACLVRMSEQMRNATVLTFDSHFYIYRRHGSQLIPLIIPSAPS